MPFIKRCILQFNFFLALLKPARLFYENSERKFNSMLFPRYRNFVHRLIKKNGERIYIFFNFFPIPFTLILYTYANFNSFKITNGTPLRSVSLQFCLYLIFNWKILPCASFRKYTSGHWKGWQDIIKFTTKVIRYKKCCFSRG